jgi:hypothetical protein
MDWGWERPIREMLDGYPALRVAELVQMLRAPADAVRAALRKLEWRGEGYLVREVATGHDVFVRAEPFDVRVGKRLAIVTVREQAERLGLSLGVVKWGAPMGAWHWLFAVVTGVSRGARFSEVELAACGKDGESSAISLRVITMLDSVPLRSAG